MDDRPYLSRRGLLELLSAGSISGIAGCGGRSGTPRNTQSTTKRPSDQITSSTETVSEDTTETTAYSFDAPEWRQASGPQGGPVTGIQYSPVDPTRMYAATPTAGVYYSTDAGRSWTQGPSHMHHMGSIVASPHDSEVAYGAGWMTTNGGLSWNQFSTNAQPWSLAFDPLDSERLYVGTGDGVSISEDGGDTWEAVPLEVGGERYGARQITTLRDGDSVLVWASDRGRVFHSWDQGQSWTVIESTRDLPHQLSMGLAVESQDPERGYLALNGHSIYLIEPGTVEPISEDIPSMAFGGKPTLNVASDGSILYAIARLRDGDEWSERTLLKYDIDQNSLTRPEVDREPYSVVTHPDDERVVSVGDELGVLTSQDRGGSWQDRSDGLIDSFLTAVAVNDTRPQQLLAGTECSGGLFVSNDLGQSWNWERSGISGHHEGEWGEHYVMHLTAHGDRAYATTASGLLMSEDGGDTWSMLQTDFSGKELTHLHGLAMHPMEPDKIYVGTGRLNAGGEPDAFEGTHIWKSTDGGDSWQELTRGFPTDADTTVQQILIDPHDPSVVYVGTNARDYLHGGNPPGEGLGVYKSTDGGERWQSLDGPARNITSLSVDADNSDLLYVSTTTGVFRSRTAGSSWERLLGDFSHRVTSHPAYPGLVFAAVNRPPRQVIVSPDSGDNWHHAGLTVRVGYSSPEPDVDAAVPYNRRKIITWLDVDAESNRIFASTQGAGLWWADLPDSLEST